MPIRVRLLSTFAMFISCLAAAPAHSAPAHLWSKGLGDAAEQSGYSVAVLNDGRVALTGALSGSADFGGGALNSAGADDIFLAMFDASGAHLWSTRFGDASNQVASSIAVDGNGNLIVTGRIAGTVDFGTGPMNANGPADVFVAKFDPDGTCLWSKRFGDGSAQLGNSIGVNGAGDIVVVGTFAGVIDFGGGGLNSAGSSDLFVAKLSSAGSHVWSRRFGDGALQSARAVAVDPSGNIVVTGEFFGVLNLGGGMLNAIGGSDLFLAKLDPNGSHLWSKRFGDGGTQVGTAIAAGSAGQIALTGYFDGSLDFGGGPLNGAGGTDAFAVELDANGSHLWSRSYGDGTDQAGRAIAIGSTGEVIVFGDFNGAANFGGTDLTSVGSTDLFLARYDATGAFLTSQQFGDADAQFALGATADGNGGFALCGRFRGEINFGGSSLMSGGLGDIFVARFVDLPTGVPAPASNDAFAARILENPARHGATLTFRLPRAEDVSLEVFDTKGRRVATRALGLLGAGDQRVVWDGRDAAAHPVAAGAYYLRLSLGTIHVTRTVLLVR